MTARRAKPRGVAHWGRWLGIGLLGLLLAACATGPSGPPTPMPTATPQPWRPPTAPIGLDTVTQLGVLGTNRQARGTTYRMNFSPNGTSMLGVSGDGAVRLWDLTQGEALWARENDSIGAAYFMTGGSQWVLVGAASRQIDVYSAADRTLLRSFSGSDEQIGPSALAIPADRLVLGTAAGSVAVWDLTNDRLEYTLAAAGMPIQGVTLSPDGRLLATYSAERIVRLWELTTGATQAILADFDNQVKTLAFSPDGSQVAIGFEAQVRVWATANGTPLLTLNTAEGAATGQLVFTPGGYLLGGGPGSDTVAMWDLSSGELYAGLPGHGQGFNGMALSPDGALLVTIAQPGSAYLWNMTDPNQRVALASPDQQITLAGWSADGRVLVLAAADGALTFWGIPGAPVPTPE